ncbi:MAG: polysaccharide deacetylase family protein [Desulfobacteraceae bacterium]|nr:polysaccharide deacetylase family protein [Desulfobacteraceae bacterium]
MKTRGKKLSALLLCFLFLILISACMHTEKKIKGPQDDRATRTYGKLIVVKTQAGDTFSSLAAKYLNDSSKDWLIREFNDMKTIESGKNIVIPRNLFWRTRLKVNGFQTVPVFLYHKFSNKTSGKYSVTQAAFEEQMKYLKENEYRIITLNQFLNFLDYNAPLHPKSVLLTFDDGWESMYDIAFPILKKYGFPATFFIYTDFIGKDQAMSWDQIRELAEYGFDIQCHTKTHQDLSESDKGESFEDYFADLEKEILIPSHLIARHLNKKCTCLAYPLGKTNSLVTAFLMEHGYRAGFTFDKGQNPFFVNNFLIRRTMVSGNCTIEEFIKNLDIFFDERESK